MTGRVFYFAFANLARHLYAGTNINNTTNVWEGVSKVPRKEDNPLQDVVNQIKRQWRHRSGLKLGERQINELEVFGKVIELENTIPGIVLDVFDNLNLVTRDDRKPVLVGRKRTDYGWHLVFNLPPGISFGQVKKVFSLPIRN